MISIIIPTYNEEKYISNCLDSVIAQDYPKESIEVFVVDGLSKDHTREIVMDYSKKFRYIQLIDNPKRIVPFALNLGFLQSTGEFIVRLDAHAIFPSNYLKMLIEGAKMLDADNVGGQIITLPANNSGKSKSIAIALSHPFGVGNSHFRIGSSSVKVVDTVPFGCFKREVFEKVGLFDCDLIRNQDDEFNARIIKNGGKIFLIPRIVIQYFARDKIRKVTKMFYQYGLFKPLVNKKLGKPATLRQFFPVLFTSGLIIGLLLSIIHNLFFFLTVLILFIYVFLAISFSINEAWKSKKISIIVILPVVFFLIHLSYGWGYLTGIFHFWILGRNSLHVNANR